MKRQLIASASAIALLFGAATAATAADNTAQEKTMQNKAAQSDTMQRSTDTKSGTAVDTRARSADTSPMRSYSDNKKDYSSAKSASGRSAEELIGADIVNAEGDEIGEIQDLVVGPDNNITTAIVEVGGFLGMGSKFVAIDIEQLQPGKDSDEFKTSLTKAQLKSNAEYKKDNGYWMQSTQ